MVWVFPSFPHCLHHAMFSPGLNHSLVGFLSPLHTVQMFGVYTTAASSTFWHSLSSPQPSPTADLPFHKSRQLLQETSKTAKSHTVRPWTVAVAFVTKGPLVMTAKAKKITLNLHCPLLFFFPLLKLPREIKHNKKTLLNFPQDKYNLVVN